MLNDQGDSVSAPEAESSAGESRYGGGIPQLLLVLGAGVYLFAMVWLYVRVPILILLFGLIAAGIIATAAVERLRDADKPPRRRD